MPTFEQTQRALLAALPAISAPLAPHRGLVVELADQRVYVTPHRALGEVWIAVAAIIGESPTIRAEAALRYNRDTPHVGSLATGDGVLQLRELLPSQTETDTIVRVIAAVAVEAGRLRRERVAPGNVELLAEWAA